MFAPTLRSCNVRNLGVHSRRHTRLNDLFGTSFTEADEVFFDGVRADLRIGFTPVTKGLCRGETPPSVV